MEKWVAFSMCKKRVSLFGKGNLSFRRKWFRCFYDKEKFLSYHSATLLTHNASQDHWESNGLVSLNSKHFVLFFFQSKDIQGNYFPLWDLCFHSSWIEVWWRIYFWDIWYFYSSWETFFEIIHKNLLSAGCWSSILGHCR